MQHEHYNINDKYCLSAKHTNITMLLLTLFQTRKWLTISYAAVDFFIYARSMSFQCYYKNVDGIITLTVVFL